MEIPSAKSLKTENMSEIQAHYNGQEILNKNDRKSSRVFHLKSLNNWVKACLIGKYCPADANALDLAGGTT